MTTPEVLMILSLICIIICVCFIATIHYRRAADRSANIMNLRNTQQAMRGHEGMRSLRVGDPFTRDDLVQYMDFPRNVNPHTIYTPGDKVTPIGELWLRVTPEGDAGGRYGMNPGEFSDW